MYSAVMYVSFVERPKGGHGTYVSVGIHGYIYKTKQKSQPFFKCLPMQMNFTTSTGYNTSDDGYVEPLAFIDRCVHIDVDTYADKIKEDVIKRLRGFTGLVGDELTGIDNLILNVDDNHLAMYFLNAGYNVDGFVATTGGTDETDGLGYMLSRDNASMGKPKLPVVYTIDIPGYRTSSCLKNKDFSPKKIYFLSHTDRSYVYGDIKYRKTDDIIGRRTPASQFNIYVFNNPLVFTDLVIKFYLANLRGVYIPTYVDAAALYDFRTVRMLELWGEKALTYDRKMKVVFVCADLPIISVNPPVGLLFSVVKRLDEMYNDILRYQLGVDKDSIKFLDITDKLFGPAGKNGACKPIVSNTTPSITMSVTPDTQYDFFFGTDLPRHDVLRKLGVSGCKIKLVVKTESTLYYSFSVIAICDEYTAMFSTPFISPTKTKKISQHP